MPDDTPIPEDDNDRPQRRRRPDDDDEEDDDRPRRRRRRRSDEDEDVGDDGLQYVIPINTSVMAIVAGYLGLISVLCAPAPFALLFGVLALVQLKKNPKLHGTGRAIFAIVMGGLFTLIGIVAIIGVALSQK